MYILLGKWQGRQRLSECSLNSSAQYHTIPYSVVSFTTEDWKFFFENTHAYKSSHDWPMSLANLWRQAHRINNWNNLWCTAEVHVDQPGLGKVKLMVKHTHYGQVEIFIAFLDITSSEITSSKDKYDKYAFESWIQSSLWNCSLWIPVKAEKNPIMFLLKREMPKQNKNMFQLCLLK